MIKTKFQDIKKIVKEIANIKNVKAVYLFGSFASGKQRPLSDIDLCVIGDLTERDKVEIAGFSSDNLDISFFNELPIYIRFRVFKDGKPLIIKDKEFVNKIKFRTLNVYLDFKPLINKYIQKTFGNVR